MLGSGTASSLTDSLGVGPLSDLSVFSSSSMWKSAGEKGVLEGKERKNWNLEAGSGRERQVKMKRKGYRKDKGEEGGEQRGEGAGWPSAHPVLQTEAPSDLPGSPQGSRARLLCHLWAWRSCRRQSSSLPGFLLTMLSPSFYALSCQGETHLPSAKYTRGSFVGCRCR